MFVDDVDDGTTKEQRRMDVGSSKELYDVEHGHGDTRVGGLKLKKCLGGLLTRV